MTVREYIGARYVPLLMGDWDNTKTYEPLSIVMHEGNSYTSRQYVPTGIAITNEVYWAATGNYNAQIESYRQETAAVANDLDTVESTIGEGFDTTTNTIANVMERIYETVGSGFDTENTVQAAMESLDTAINAVDGKIGGSFTSEDTVADAINTVDDKIGGTFTSEDTVADAIDDINNTISDLSANLIRGTYIEPEYIGDYTAYSGKYITSNANADDPYRPQGFCYKANGEMTQLLINGAENLMRTVTMDAGNNTVSISGTSRSGFGHANQVEYVPSKSQYYVNDGLGHILVCNSSFTVITSVNIPNENWAVFVYDRKNDKAYVVDYYSHIYNYDLDNNTITDSGKTLSVPVQTGSITVQGAACYNNVIVFPISKKPSGLVCYDITTGNYICTVTFNQNGDELYPISEIEDCSFDDNGDMYFSCATVLTDMAYCMVGIIWKCNIFTGMPVTPWWTTSTEKHNAYIECVNYTGFYSNGQKDYPFKSIESFNIHAQHQSAKIKGIYFGVNSNHSSTTTQHWFGFVYLSNINAYLKFPPTNNVIIHGTLEFRDSCNAWIVNRAICASCYNHPDGKTFLFRVDNSTVLGQTFEGVSGYDDDAIARVILLQYAIMVILNGALNTGNYPQLIGTNQIKGYGYSVNVSPHTQDGSWS